LKRKEGKERKGKERKGKEKKINANKEMRREKNQPFQNLRVRLHPLKI